MKEEIRPRGSAAGSGWRSRIGIGRPSVFDAAAAAFLSTLAIEGPEALLISSRGLPWVESSPFLGAVGQRICRRRWWP